MDRRPRDQPVVLIIASEDGSHERLGAELFRVFESALPDSVDSYTVSEGEQRPQLEAALFEKLRAGPALIAVHGLHRLAGTAPLLLHTLADNENAPFRNVIYMFTTELSFGADGPASASCADSIVE